jgi:hypothetical protein
MNLKSGQGFRQPAVAATAAGQGDSKRGIKAPVTVDGEDGIVIGNPPIELGTAEPGGVRRPGVLARLPARLRRD